MKVISENISVVIPTYQRNQVLLDTISYLLDLNQRPAETIVVDQTQKHERKTEQQLSLLDKNGIIRWIKLQRPSIPHAMNVGLFEASCPIVFFVDDDIIPTTGLIGAHSTVYQKSEEIWAVVGQVLQPGEESVSDSFSYKQKGLYAHLDFRFCSTSRKWIKSVIACNLSVRRDKALEIGGFDENFIGVAYRFETEFCRRVWQHGGKVLFEPSASIRHLRADRGGTRQFGNHLCSPSPMHGIGDYYFALRHGVNPETFQYILRRPFREIFTKFHLMNPWCIPVKLFGEIRALLLAIKLHKKGPKLIDSVSSESLMSRANGR
jgi:GT2 family glycosyltransferase